MDSFFKDKTSLYVFYTLTDKVRPSRGDTHYGMPFGYDKGNAAVIPHYPYKILVSFG